MVLTITSVLLLSTILSQLYQHRRMQELEAHVGRVETMTQTSYNHVEAFDKYIREMWNSRARLRVIMHPDQQLQQSDTGTPEATSNAVGGATQ